MVLPVEDSKFLQTGHWKSSYRSIVTGASVEPTTITWPLFAVFAGAAASDAVAVREFWTTMATTTAATSTTAATTAPISERCRRCARARARASAARFSSMRARAARRLALSGTGELLLGERAAAEGQPRPRPAGEREGDEQQCAVAQDLGGIRGVGRGALPAAAEAAAVDLQAAGPRRADAGDVDDEQHCRGQRRRP